MPEDDHPTGTHLRVIVVADQFREHNLIDRHRMVHEALKEAFARGLHALELKALTPEEWQSRSKA